MQASINNTGYGSNEMGENLPAIGLGTGKTADQMVASVLHTCALLNDGNSKCWGAGRCGRLGQGGMLGALIYFHCFLKPADKKKQESREIQMAKV